MNTTMNNNRVMYNLSNIPDFNNILNNSENINNKYINVINYTTKQNKNYKIIKYNKDLLSNDLADSYGLLRSVIVNSSGKVLCFSPPKSINTDEFIKKYPKRTDKIIAEEFVEGTMINVFFDNDDGANGEWKIATKNTVDGNVSFFKSSEKTFNAMFIETCDRINLKISNLNPSYCYSFVLQHPNNRIVLPIKKSNLYLVAVYQIQQHNNQVVVYEENMDVVTAYGFWNNSFIKFCDRYGFETYSELIEKYASPNTSYNIMGVIIKNVESGERCKIRNPIYEEIKHLRGNQSKLQYQYLYLRQLGKVNDFLKYYPEFRQELSIYRDQLHMFTNTLFQNYISCYIKKEKPLKDFSSQYRTHMFKIHEKYLNELREKQLFVTNTVVINYVNNLPPALLMYCLNYNMRKHNIDVVKLNNLTNI
jgi:hypothetical protein